MADYIAALTADTVEQYKEKNNITALLEVFGRQLQEVYDFYLQLLMERSLYSAVGNQLDSIGDNLALSRAEARNLTTEDIDDETYRKYLIYKILKNTSDCTYSDLIKAVEMFWDHPIHYAEDKNQPATIILSTDILDGNEIDTTPLLQAPLVRPAGVTLKLYATTETEITPTAIGLGSAFGVIVSEIPIPEKTVFFSNTGPHLKFVLGGKQIGK